MIEQVKPYLPAIDSYLRQFGGAPLTEAADAMEFQSILVWKLLKGRTLAG
jgi:hypothetical protein